MKNKIINVIHRILGHCLKIICRSSNSIIYTMVVKKENDGSQIPVINHIYIKDLHSFRIVFPVSPKEDIKIK